MFCTKCGSELPEGVRHCFVCGTSVRQLPPLRTGPDFPAGQPGQNTPAPPAPPPHGSAARQAQTQSGPAYQAPPQDSPAAASGPAYQTDPPQGAARPNSVYPPPPPVSPAYHYPAYHHDLAADTPDTVGLLDWLLSTLITFVPVVGLVLLCIWAFTDSVKPSKRNWARATLILYLALFALFFGLSFYLALTDPTLMG